MTSSIIPSLSLSLMLVACASSPEPAPTPQQASPAEQAAAAAPASSVPVYDGNTTQAIKARAGERFTVALPANITTPFKWVVATPNEAVVKIVADEYKDAPPPGCQGCVGYGGTTSLTFEAVAPGAHALNLAYRGLGQADAPAQREVAIQLTVE